MDIRPLYFIFWLLFAITVAFILWTFGKLLIGSFSEASPPPGERKSTSGTSVAAGGDSHDHDVMDFGTDASSESFDSSAGGGDWGGGDSSSG